MHWTPIDSPEHPIPKKLADVLRTRFGPDVCNLTTDFVNGGCFRYYLKGLSDAGVAGAEELLVALHKYETGGIRIHS